MPLIKGHSVAAVSFLLVAVAAAMAGCPAPVCTTGATRCAMHQTVQVCDGRGQWRQVADCGEVQLHSGGEWACGQTLESGREVSACLPESP